MTWRQMRCWATSLPAVTPSATIQPKAPAPGDADPVVLLRALGVVASRQEVMREGWAGDEYLILFDASEITSVTEGYAIPRFLPGHHVAGLVGWDDFLLVDGDGQRICAPTVPLDLAHARKAERAYEDLVLTSDARFTGRIKWYVKPLVFGGEAALGPNVTWADLGTHQQLVRFWNDRYRLAAGR